MPTSRRSWARAALPVRPTSWPQTVIMPSCTVSSPAMQRKSVLLPEPERPTMATVWPRVTSRLTPSSTRRGPNSLTTLSTQMTDSPVGLLASGMCPPFQRAGGDRERVAQHEVDGGDGGEDRERLEGRVVDDLAGARQFDEADHRGERGVLHDLNHEAHGRRDSDAHRLRQDYVGVLLERVEAQAIGGLPLGLRHRFDAAAPDLAQESRRVDRERDAGRDQRVELVAQDSKPEIRQEEHDQQWRALDELDVAAGQPAQHLRLGDPHQRDRQADHGAADERDYRQADRPARRLDQVDEMIEAELDHSGVPSRRRRSNRIRT